MPLMMKTGFLRSVGLCAAGVLGVMGTFGSNDIHAAQLGVGAAVGPQKPNVLLILADDLGYSDLGCMGGEISTPHLDALAKGGLCFTQFYNSARCCPSRASLLTGLHPHQAGFPQMTGVLPNSAVTLPEVLKPAGYNSYMVGKWHLSERVNPVMRGFDEFYGMLGGFNSFWEEKPYYTRLPVGQPQREYKPSGFYATDAFGDYSLDFIEQGQQAGQPWFLYLAFNAPHFPLHAPEKVVIKYEKLYRKGWDVIRTERLARQKKLGIVPKNLALTPRSNVPKNWINVQTGWADKDNPAWESLTPARRADLARRMAVYAAMVEIMDTNIGRVVAHLKQSGQLNNTLVFFLSDNGACAEWDPYGFDKLNSPQNVLHVGDELKKIGTSESYVSYGSGWANASNTPWRLYKHYAHEGGIRTPLIVHWPAGLKVKAGTLSEQPGYITDFMPTVLEACGAVYPAERNGQKILPHEGTSLLPVMRGQSLPQRVLCMEHEGNRMVREGHWKLVALKDKSWELYDLSSDAAEMHDLAAREPARVEKLSAAWEAWAQRCKVKPVDTPQIVGKALTITCDVTPQSRDGVILAHGGDQRGYALHLQEGKPIFSVRQNGKLYVIAAPSAPQGKFSLEAHLETDGTMTLAVEGIVVARGKAPSVFTVQPLDAFSIGEDVQSAVGDYMAPNPLKAKIENVKVRTD
jgi:arylsulfatase A-like enzyme